MDAPALKIPEVHKRPGVVYAVSDDGVELPVIDVTHPAFALRLTGAELESLTGDFIRESARYRRWPAFLRRLFFRLVLSRSVLGGGVVKAAGSFLNSLNTYLMKLGPDNLGRYATPLDRRLAAALPALSMRLRLQDVAELLARELTPRLEEKSGRPCHLVNIGGGSAIDSLNALMLLRRDRPRTLEGRSIRIHVLDIDPAGPNFGMRALAALGAEGARLHGLDVRLDHVVYDWAHAGRLSEALTSRLPPDAVVGTSSEGALFEYGSDDEIVANLRALAASTPAGAFAVGSVTRGDGPARQMDTPTRRRVAVRPRSADAFAAVVHRADWTIAQLIERPFSRQVVLVAKT
jgi:hypothetical protein